MDSSAWYSRFQISNDEPVRRNMLHPTHCTLAVESCKKPSNVESRVVHMLALSVLGPATRVVAVFLDEEDDKGGPTLPPALQPANSEKQYT